MNRTTGRKDSEIHSFFHWAIMTRTTGRTNSEIHSFSHRATTTRATERTDSEIRSFPHWAIITRTTERADSEIHSFSHWAIMAGATERTDRELHSFSHWDIMTRATERTDSEMHNFSHWAIMTDCCWLGEVLGCATERLHRMTTLCYRSILWTVVESDIQVWHQWIQHSMSQPVSHGIRPHHLQSRGCSAISIELSYQGIWHCGPSCLWVTGNA